MFFRRKKKIHDIMPHHHLQDIARKLKKSLEQQGLSIAEATAATVAAQTFLDVYSDRLYNFKPTLNKLKEHVFQWASKLYNSVVGGERLLPVGCRFIKKTQKGWQYVIEQQPCRRAITVANEYNMPEMGCHDISDCLQGFTRYLLSFPYIIFIIHVTQEKISLKVAFRNEPLKNLQDVLYVPFLPNISDDLTPCLFVAGYATDIITIENAISRFWQTNFTHFLYPVTFVDPRIVNFIRWEQESAGDPLFTLKVNWLPYAPLESVLQEFPCDYSFMPPKAYLNIFNETMRFFQV